MVNSLVTKASKFECLSWNDCVRFKDFEDGTRAKSPIYVVNPHRYDHASKYIESDSIFMHVNLTTDSSFSRFSAVRSEQRGGHPEEQDSILMMYRIRTGQVSTQNRGAVDFLAR